MALLNISQLMAFEREKHRVASENSFYGTILLESELRNFSQFNESKRYDIFLSHSYKDHKAIAWLAKYLKEQYEYEIYVDWIEDKTLDRSQVSKETAKIIKSRMKNCKCLFYNNYWSASHSIIK